jgi:organic radical activating enzyme
MSLPTSERERALWAELAGLEPPDRSKPYRSCGYIEGGVVFWPTYISACCVMHSGGTTGIPYLAGFGGGDLPIAEVLQTRKKMIETHQAGGDHPGCAGCPNLVEAQWGPKDYLVDNITLAHYTHCNLKCNYCYTVLKPEGNIKPKDVYSLLDTFQSMIANGALSERSVIRISGGEPAMMREFEKLIDTIVDYGPHIIVFTNAVLYSEALARGLAKGRIEAVLGIDAGSDAAYRLVKGTDDVEEAWENTARYAAINPEMTWAKMIVYQDNMDDVDAFVARCVEANVQRVYCDIEATACHQPETLPQVIEALGRLKYECDKRGILALYGEAGAQNLEGVLGEAQQRYRDVAEGDLIGRAMLFRGDLVDRIGVDGWTYEAAARLLPLSCRERLIDCWARGYNAAGNPTDIVAETNEILEAEFRAAELPLEPSYSVQLGYPNVPGFDWGPAESNNGRQRWRWIGPSGASSLLLALDPSQDYELCLRVSTARDMDVLDGLTVDINRLPLARIGTGWSEGFYEMRFEISAAELPTTGRAILTVRVATDQPIRAAALESVQITASGETLASSHEGAALLDAVPA